MPDKIGQQPVVKLTIFIGMKISISISLRESNTFPLGSQLYRNQQLSLVHIHKKNKQTNKQKKKQKKKKKQKQKQKHTHKKKKTVKLQYWMYIWFYSGLNMQVITALPETIMYTDKNTCTG